MKPEIVSLRGRRTSETFKAEHCAGEDFTCWNCSSVLAPGQPHRHVCNGGGFDDPEMTLVTDETGWPRRMAECGREVPR
jgi:hypothetical protein